MSRLRAGAQRGLVGDYVSKSSRLRGFRRGEPIRVTIVQLGGSLAGKVCSRLSSSMLSTLVTAGTCGWRLRRPIADPRRAVDRGVMSPTALLLPRSNHRAGSRMIHLLPLSATGRDRKPARARWFPRPFAPRPRSHSGAASPRTRRPKFVILRGRRPARGHRPAARPRCRSSRSARSRPHSRGRRWPTPRGHSARPAAPSSRPA